MANHVSAAKRARQRIRRTSRNRLLLGLLRTSLKRARTALSTGNANAPASSASASARNASTGGVSASNTAEASTLVLHAARAAAKAASKGIIHKNAAARLSSRLQRALNKLGA
jgi:small subunit ribosomal protein S20